MFWWLLKTVRETKTAVERVIKPVWLGAASTRQINSGNIICIFSLTPPIQAKPALSSLCCNFQSTVPSWGSSRFLPHRARQSTIWSWSGGGLGVVGGGSQLPNSQPQHKVKVANETSRSYVSKSAGHQTFPPGGRALRFWPWKSHTRRQDALQTHRRGCRIKPPCLRAPLLNFPRIATPQ